MSRPLSSIKQKFFQQYTSANTLREWFVTYPKKFADVKSETSFWSIVWCEYRCETISVSPGSRRHTYNLVHDIHLDMPSRFLLRTPRFVIQNPRFLRNRVDFEIQVTSFYSQTRRSPFCTTSTEKIDTYSTNWIHLSSTDSSPLSKPTGLACIQL